MGGAYQFIKLLYREGGAPCFRIGGAEDNFIFYIDEIKVKVQYFKAISIHFMSNFSLRAHFPPKNIVIW